MGIVVLIALLSKLVGLCRWTAAANRTPERLSLTDPLTLAANRRAFDHALAVEWRRSIRRNSPVSMIMIDIDRFKTFNDHYGRARGDACLQLVATAICGGARHPVDVAARFGGEEFVLLLPGLEAAGALRVAAAVQNAIAALQIVNDAIPSGRVTASFGVATLWTSRGDGSGLVESAGRAMYRAKQSGGNRICLAEAPNADLMHEAPLQPCPASWGRPRARPHPTMGGVGATLDS
jgi:diguanylate cyclase (GGDEF)-like protein